MAAAHRIRIAKHVALRSAQNGVYAVFVVFTFAFLFPQISSSGNFLEIKKAPSARTTYCGGAFSRAGKRRISVRTCRSYELPHALTTISKIIALQIKRQLNTD